MRTLGIALLTLASCTTEGPEVGTRRLALGAALLPDMVEEISHLGVQNKQQRSFLRFSSTHWNQGAGPLQIRGATETGPCPPEVTGGTVCTFAKQELLDSEGNGVAVHDAGVSVFHIEHNHWHQGDVAEFELRAGSLDGPAVASSTKVTFCLIDYDSDPDFVDRRSTRQYFDCDGTFQGVSVGWGDEYHHSTPGQELDITDVAVGDYYLTHLVNPAGNWLESNYGNNFSWVKLRLSRKGANPEIKELDRKECPVTDASDPEYQVICGNTSNK